MKKEKKTNYEPGKIIGGISDAIRIAAGFAVVLIFAAVAVLTVYAAVKGGQWIWSK